MNQFKRYEIIPVPLNVPTTPPVKRRQPRASHDIGFSLDSNANILVTDIATRQRIVVLRGAFIRITGAHPQATAGRFVVSRAVYTELGFIAERREPHVSRNLEPVASA